MARTGPFHPIYFSWHSVFSQVTSRLRRRAFAVEFAPQAPLQTQARRDLCYPQSPLALADRGEEYSRNSVVPGNLALAFALIRCPGNHRIASNPAITKRFY